ncbi:MAG: class I SAM-dependent methyltransferase [Gammaproteobacteria bacterium]
MINTGFIGGQFGYRPLRRLGRDAAAEQGYCSGSAYSGISKLEALFGARIWNDLKQKSVLDFGCGTGREVIEIAQHGARRVVGLEMRRKVLDIGSRDAHSAGVAQRCIFTTHTDEKFDVIFSIDGFEHYDDAATVLRALHGLLQPGGRLYIAFGPTWFHSLGGHLFSVFPWVHLIFTEKALLRWRADFKTDGARRFHEVEGGLNQMTIRHFRKLAENSDFEFLEFQPVPIKGLERLCNKWTQELFTSIVRCVLTPRMAHRPASNDQDAAAGRRPDLDTAA